MIASLISYTPQIEKNTHVSDCYKTTIPNSPFLPKICTMSSWFWRIILLVLLCLIHNHASAAAKHNSQHHAVLVGTVLCQTCSGQDPPTPAQFRLLPGASVAVECKNPTSSTPNFRQQLVTNNHGEFRLRLPFRVGKHATNIHGCSVHLLRSNHAACAVPAVQTSSSFRLKSRQPGGNIFSSGFLTFKPMNQPQLCDQKQTSGGPFYLPPLPQLPSLPPLPQLPPLPGTPYLPPVNKGGHSPKASQLKDKNGNQATDFLLLPNPFNPPSIFPPNPFQPPPAIFPPLIPSPPPTSIFPPLFPAPPPPSNPPFSFPPIPGLIPPPSPPSPPSNPPFTFPPIPGLIPPPSPPPHPTSLPNPLPAFPFRPTAGFPGLPPAEISSKSKANSP